MADGPLRKVMRHIHELVGATPADALTDRQLLERFAQRRDEAAFAALVERHGPLVLGVCRRVLRHRQDAEDAFQATFHVLARKAGSAGWHDSIANWLYEVALRVAHKSRVGAARRHLHEGHSATEPAASPQEAWHELKQVLDEELARMPRKLRAPLILCYLEGKTRDEAAADLGWTLGTVKGRLERGREMLRGRLEKRGLSLSAALFGVALGESAASAAVPAPLAGTTVAGAITGNVSADVAALAKTATQAVFWARIKVAGTALAAAAVVGLSLGWAIPRSWPGKPATPGTVASRVEDTSQLPEKLRGQRALVAFDNWGGKLEPQEIQQRTSHIENSLKKAGVRAFEPVAPNLLLIDPAGRDLAAILPDVPHRMGAMVFQDGQFRAAHPYENPHHKGVLLLPEPFVRIGYQTHDGLGVMRLQRDVQAYSNQGLVVERDRDGVTEWLKLTPGKSKTLLEVFLFSGAGFTYAEKKPHE